MWPVDPQIVRANAADFKDGIVSSSLNKLKVGDTGPCEAWGPMRPHWLQLPRAGPGGREGERDKEAYWRKCLGFIQFRGGGLLFVFAEEL